MLDAADISTLIANKIICLDQYHFVSKAKGSVNFDGINPGGKPVPLSDDRRIRRVRRKYSLADNLTYCRIDGQSALSWDTSLPRKTDCTDNVEDNRRSARITNRESGKHDSHHRRRSYAHFSLFQT